MRITLFLVLFCLFIGKTYSQPEMTYWGVDTLSYQALLNGEHRFLKQITEDALDAGIDFYYLRMRVGISCYQERDYENAMIHFRVASQMYPADSVVKEYLYYALLFSGRSIEAFEYAQTLPARLRSTILYLPKKVIDVASSFETISITAGALLNDNIEVNKPKNFRGTGFRAENTLQGNIYFFNFYLQNRLNNRWRIFNQFSYFNVNSLGIVQSVLPTEMRNYSNHNYQYTGGINYQSKTRWSVNASIGFFQENANDLTAVIVPKIQQPPNVPQPPLPPNMLKVEYNDNPFQYTASWFSVGLEKRFSHFQLGVSVAGGTLSNNIQKQIETQLTWYPFVTPKLYFSSTATYLRNDNENQYIFSQTFGGSLSKMISLEAKFSYGKHQNYIGNRGLWAFNTVEPILILGSLNMPFRFNRLTVIPAYGIQQKRATYLLSMNPESSNKLTYTYFTHLLNLSFLWNL